MSARRLLAVAACAAVLVLGWLVGSGAGSASARHGGPTATTGTATVPTQPLVTVQTTPTTPAADLPGYGKPVIQLGDMNTPEQFILGQLYELALEHEGYTVELTRNIGPQETALRALQQGTLDVYPDYLDYWNTQIAGLHHRFHSLRTSYDAGAAYARDHGYELLSPTPFSDTSGIAVTTEYAINNHISSIDDLARGPQIVVGVPLELETGPTGLPALEHAYGLVPAYEQPIDIGLQFWWLDSGNVQAAYDNTTDAQLAGPEYRELRDPKHVFGFGNVVPVTTPKVLAAEGPAFRQTLDRVDSVLTLAAMRGLNREVVVDHHKTYTVAEQFLQGNGILPRTIFRPWSGSAAGASNAT